MAGRRSLTLSALLAVRAHGQGIFHSKGDSRYRTNIPEGFRSYYCGMKPKSFVTLIFWLLLKSRSETESLLINCSWPSWNLCMHVYECEVCKVWKSVSRVQLFATPWTIQSMEVSRPGYWPVPFSKGSSQPRDRTCLRIASGFFTSWAIYTLLNIFALKHL